MSGVYRHCERCDAEMPAIFLPLTAPRHHLCDDCNEAFDEWVEAGSRPSRGMEVVDWQRDLLKTIWHIPDDHGPASGYALDKDGDVWVRQPDLRWKEPWDDEHDPETWSEVVAQWGPMVELRPAEDGAS